MLEVLLGAVLFIAIILPLVVVHEYGHFLVAKRNDIEVEEFGVGFPPRLYGRKLGRGIFRAYYTINALPLGGFVSLKGESDSDKRRGSFGRASYLVKLKVLLAGVGMNYLVAILAFSVMAAVRLPVIIDDQFTVSSDTSILRSDVRVAEIVSDSAAERAGLEDGDYIESLAGQGVSSSEQLGSLTSSLAGQEIEIVYARGGQRSSTEVRLGTDSDDSEGRLGVKTLDRIERRSTWSALLVGFVFTNQLAWESLQLLGSGISSIVKGDREAAAESGIAGPVGIVSILGEGISSVSHLLLIVGSLSLSLALLNAMPIPALDGGRLALISVFRLLRRPLPKRVEELVHGIGFVALLGLIVVVSIFDVINFY